MGKRKEMEEPHCDACGHLHKYGKGEACGGGGGGHRIAPALDRPTEETIALPSEILEGFLYLGSFHDAAHSDLLQALGITHILNTAPESRDLYKATLISYCLQEQCYIEKARVLVHGMSGRNRSAAIAIAYLMKCKRWNFAQSFQWVKDRRPLTELSTAVQEQLRDYEQKILGSHEPPAVQSFNFEFPQVADAARFRGYHLFPKPD